MLSTKKGKEAYVEPVIEGREYRFAVKVGTPPDQTSAKRGSKSGGSGSPFLCLMSGSPMPFDYLRGEGKSGRLGSRLLAIVAEGDRERVYLTPTAAHEQLATATRPAWTPDTELPQRALGFRVQEYGMLHWRDLFTGRQLVALTTFSDLVGEAMERARCDAAAVGLTDAGAPLCDGGTGARAYAEAVAVYLAFAISKLADRGSSICTWFTERDSTRNTFSRQSIPMTWDYAELNTLLDGTGSFLGAVEWTAESTDCLAWTGRGSRGSGLFADAATQVLSTDRIISTDPPYYDNIGYADLSDFFYIW